MLIKARGNMYDWVTHEWRPLIGQCSHKCSYCLVADTSILMSDFSIKKIQDVKIGEKILGINRKDNKGFYKFEFAKVTNLSKRIAKTIKLNTKHHSIECSPEHLLMGSSAIRNCSDWKQAKGYSPYENLRFIGEPNNESDELLIGWLSGFCDGDGCFFKHCKQEYLGFEAVCIDKKLRESVITIASRFGIELRLGEKLSSKKSLNKGKKNKMIFSRKDENVRKLKELIKFDKRGIEFYKGYLAGMLDSDGSVNKYVRIFQSKKANKIKYERIRTCLHALQIKYTEERAGFLLHGGFEMRTRLLFQCKPKHSKKSIKLIIGFSVKGSRHSEITNMRIGNKNTNVYNLETSCGNFIANGFIVHNCYVTSIHKRYNKTQKPLRLKESELKTNLGENNFIFVCSTCDLFSEAIPEDWILKTLAHCAKYPKNKYLFQSKNPKRIYELRVLIPKKSVIGTTIETNRRYPEMGRAPEVDERAFFMGYLSTHFKTCVTIEPIMDFDVDELVSLIRICHPTWVNIGADSKGNKLPEPTKEKILELVEELNKFTEIRKKTNLGRILGGGK